MDRRALLTTAGAAGAMMLGARNGAFAQPARDEPDPEAVGEGKLDVLTSGPDGRIIVTDSTSYLDKRVNEHDVIVASSFAGPTIIGGALAKGVKALIAHDAGVGKDQAAIGGLPYGDRYGVPIAAVDCRTATLSNGNSALAGTISHANEAATKLGVRAGQSAREAAQLLLKAPPGKPVPLALDLDNKLYEMEVTPKGRILRHLGAVLSAQGRDLSERRVLGRHAFRPRRGRACVSLERQRLDLQRRRAGQEQFGDFGAGDVRREGDARGRGRGDVGPHRRRLEHLSRRHHLGGQRARARQGDRHWHDRQGRAPPDDRLTGGPCEKPGGAGAPPPL